jgi:hypothetical protein
LHDLARLEIEVNKVAAGVNENDAGPRELFENEALASKEACTQAPRERDVELHRSFGADEAVALGQKRLAGAKFDGLQLARIAAGKTDLALAATNIISRFILVERIERLFKRKPQGKTQGKPAK